MERAALRGDAFGLDDGRADKDPSDDWYQGELAFFDFYIIPLAKKLEDCGVFGVSSHEYLCYALARHHVSWWCISAVSRQLAVSPKELVVKSFLMDDGFNMKMLHDIAMR